MEDIERFEASLRIYDHELRVARRPSVGYVVERMIRNMPHRDRERIAAVYARTLRRAHKPLLSREEAAKQERFRRETLAKLEALQQGRVIVLYLPDLAESTLQSALGALKASDGWAYGKYDGDASAAAANYAAKQNYQEEFEARQREFRNRRDARDRAKEFVERVRWLEGSTVAVSG